MYGIRGVSGKFLGLLLLAANFEHEAKEPEAARVWGKEYRGHFRGEERPSKELVSTDTWPVTLRFLIILSSRGGVEKLKSQDKMEYTKENSRERDSSFSHQRTFSKFETNHHPPLFPSGLILAQSSLRFKHISKEKSDLFNLAGSPLLYGTLLRLGRFLQETREEGLNLSG